MKNEKIRPCLKSVLHVVPRKKGGLFLHTFFYTILDTIFTILTLFYWSISCKNTYFSSRKM